MVLRKMDDNLLVLTPEQLLEWYSMSELIPAPPEVANAAAATAASVSAAVAAVAANTSDPDTTSTLQHKNSQAGLPKKIASKKFVINRLTAEKIDQLKGEAGRFATELKVSPNTGSLPRLYLEQLCEALKENTSIEAVDFDNCGFGDVGCTAVEQLLLSSASLMSVSLQYCDISDTGVLQVLGAFEKGGPSVRSLILSQNSLTAASADQFERVQKKYPTLLLGLKGNKLSKKNLDDISRWHVHNALQLHTEALQANRQRETNRQHLLEEQLLEEQAALKLEEDVLEHEQDQLQHDEKDAMQHAENDDVLQQDEKDAPQHAEKDALQHAEKDALQQPKQEEKRLSEYNDEPP